MKNRVWLDEGWRGCRLRFLLGNGASLCAAALVCGAIYRLAAGDGTLLGCLCTLGAGLLLTLFCVLETCRAYQAWKTASDGETMCKDSD